VPDSALIALELADPGASATSGPIPAGERMPIIRHISGSENGGWPLFCRLLLWATRNAGDRMYE
jgi:hypothetical protein